jgi:hypothetical protein
MWVASLTEDKGSGGIRASQNGRVNALITAESIIAGFMIAYGALGGQLLIYWGKHGRPETTYLAGILVNAIILTCLASIYILFRSINRGYGYWAGYNLFKLALFGSSFFVIINAISITHFTAFSPHTAISLPDTCHLVFASGGAFGGYVSFLAMVVWKSCLAQDPSFFVFLIIVLSVLGAAVAIILSFVCPFTWCHCVVS